MNDYKPMELSKATINRIAEQAGIAEICEIESYCRDSDENSRKDTMVTVVGFDKAGRKKKYFFQITTWEEITNDKD